MNDGFGYEENEEMTQIYEDNWTIYCEKGYIELQDELRAKCSKKKYINGWLTFPEKSRNQCVSDDRVLLKNVSGRLCLSGLFSQK